MSLTLQQQRSVEYLRTRHRWSPELEKELIAAFERGESPNMCEFGCTPKTAKALLDTVNELCEP